jgi:uncharacterized integral membrane protein
MMESNDHDHRDHRSVEGGQRGPSLFLIVFLVIVAVAVVFVIQNSNRVSTEFLFFDANARLWVVILIAIGLGVLLDRFVQIWWRHRRRD